VLIRRTLGLLIIRNILIRIFGLLLVELLIRV